MSVVILEGTKYTIEVLVPNTPVLALTVTVNNKTISVT
jgi:hypothetical protein